MGTFLKRKYNALTPVSHYKLDQCQWGRTVASVTTGAPCLFIFQDMSVMKEANKHRKTGVIRQIII